ncbi:hypothetical protein Psfp_00166 [Pelotomaculum sp. FP]|nr:hypothetical protein Psfp_00166 [Pelotomaculum sp. FP]
MKVFLEKRELEFKDGVTLEAVIGPREIKRIGGIIVNGKSVPLEQVGTYLLHEGDRIHTIRFIAGG